MANATQTIAGDIQLAGDLGGNNNAASPALVNTSVTPGAYSTANITVDSKGRLTSASSATPVQVANIMPVATTTTKGVVSIGDGLSIDGAGVVSLDPPTASYTTAGIVSIDSVSLVVSAGHLSMPVASPTQLGGIKVGSGLTMTGEVLSALPVAIATNSTTGVVRIGSGLSITGDGTLSLNAPIATPAVVGAVRIGSGLSIAGDGTLSLNAPIATPAVVGAVRIGSGLSITGDGTLSVNLGSTGIALLDSNNTFTKTVSSMPTVLTSGVTINVDASASNLFTLTLAHNGTLSNPTNLAAGEYTFVVRQDGVGGRTLNFGSAYKFKNGDTKTLSTGASITDVIVCISDGTSLFCSIAKGYA